MTDSSAFAEVEGRSLLAIRNVDGMPPFLMSVVSATDLWMFAASNGALTAGRGSPQQALFPYETVDRIYERTGLGGPFTGLRVKGTAPWFPFGRVPRVEGEFRHLYKSPLGDRLVFESVHGELGLSFRSTWCASERYGWVRQCVLTAERNVEVEVLDGFLDLMPAGVELSTQQKASCLVDAYRHTEFHPDLKLGIYTLSSRLTDRAEPAEALLANVVWRVGLPGETYITPTQVGAWRSEASTKAVRRIRGEKGAYLARASVALMAGESANWSMAGDAGLDASAMTRLAEELSDPGMADRLAQDLRETEAELERLAARVDGLQRTNDPVISAHHLSNAMFNGLRGGVFLDDGYIHGAEIRRFFEHRNRGVAKRHERWLDARPERCEIDDIRASALAESDPNLTRLVDELMPLGFGRRHGDPSRPWNQFSIQTRAPDGSRRIHYEGNWRDIFQNWEAAALSFPDFLPSMVAKFVNASTMDGFNPYRISWDGVDWEAPDPHDPWSNIGYWGDHQLIYLLRLLEALDNYRPDLLSDMMDRKSFSFADVPYRIVSYEALVKDARDSIRYDDDLEQEIVGRVEAMGTDGRLVMAEDGVAHTHLLEKLLIPVLSKLSNLVPEGGVWMNTQRPEWNDANNALAGPGLSVVTSAHLLRFVRYLGHRVLTRTEPVELCRSVHTWLAEVDRALQSVGEGTIDDQARRKVVDDLGGAFSRYRDAVYSAWVEDRVVLEPAALRSFLHRAQSVLEQTLRANRRSDGLYHAYNTLELAPGVAKVNHLYLMLEGQVAIIDAQVLTPGETVTLVDELFRSALHREDQNTFILYPDRSLPDFLERNRVSEAEAEAIPSVARWLEDGDARILARDAKGQLHFHADLINVDALRTRLAPLGVPGEERLALEALYEATFNHDSFTGRSGGMYAYEGLGSIYWHMVAKLFFGLQESFVRARDDGLDTAGLAAAYHRVRQGFGFNKSAEEYGAFPTDPYSHTPGHTGAQQPGMTGFVKEQVLARFGELGVRLREGKLTFEPSLLLDKELCQAESTWSFPNAHGVQRSVMVPPNGLGFTLAGVPVVYRFGADTEEKIILSMADGASETLSGLSLDRAHTLSLLQHRGQIAQLEVNLRSDRILTAQAS